MLEMHELGVINPTASTGNYTPEQPHPALGVHALYHRRFWLYRKGFDQLFDVSSSDPY